MFKSKMLNLKITKLQIFNHLIQNPYNITLINLVKSKLGIDFTSSLY